MLILRRTRKKKDPQIGPWSPQRLQQLSSQGIRLDHGGSWVQIPSGTQFFFFESSSKLIFPLSQYYIKQLQENKKVFFFYFFIKLDETWLQLINLTNNKIEPYWTQIIQVYQGYWSQNCYIVVNVQYFHSCQLQVISISFMHNSVFLVCTALLNMNVVHVLGCTYNFYLQAKLSGFSTRVPVCSCRALVIGYCLVSFKFLSLSCMDSFQ